MILIYSALHVLVGFLNQIDALACHANGFVRDRQFCGNRVCIFFFEGRGELCIEDESGREEKDGGRGSCNEGKEDEEERG